MRSRLTAFDHLPHGRMLFATACFIISTAAPCLQAQGTESPWNTKVLEQAPAYETTDRAAEPDVRSILFEGEVLAGQPTKVFAYVGLPSNATKEDRVPGIVCVHGGGGTAFSEWVRIWNRHGFAAIAIDTNGAIPTNKNGKIDKVRHEWAGPEPHGFDQGKSPPADQWPYHAVAAIIRANSLLRSLPEVESEKVGITGISWGGYLTCLASSVDHRFKFAIPVYGCGFLEEGPSWSKTIDKYGHDRWMQLWDPSSHLKNATCPMLWVSGTNDRHYYLPMLQKSYRLPEGDRTLTIRVRMEHSHHHGWIPPEIYEFAKSAVGLSAPLIQITRLKAQPGNASINYVCPPEVSLKSATLNYTTDRGDWYDRKWEQAPAVVEAGDTKVTAELPKDSTAYFFELRDSRGLLVSSEHVVRD